MVKRLVRLCALMLPCVVAASPIRYELDLLPGPVHEGNNSWDHAISNAENFGCGACHTSIDQLGPQGNVSTPTASGAFALNTMKFKFYGDTANIGKFPDPASTVAALQNTGTAAGYYLYPGRSTFQVPFIDPLTPLSSIIQLSAGYAHTCALTSVGAVMCWGTNSSGQLGNGSSAAAAFPVPVHGLSAGVKSIAAGVSHTCAIISTGGVVCWGGNSFGQLGNNTTTGSSVPLPVSGLSGGVTALAAGWGHTCAVKSTGGAVCWGYNEFGELGNNTTTNSLVPVAVSGAANNLKSIASGYLHTCAITFTGGAVCWGSNTNGELGNNTTANSPVAVPVVGLNSPINFLTANGGHTCAITASSGAVCWGENDANQLGNGTYMNSSIPVPVTGLSSGVTAIAAGYTYTCAISSTSAACWGYDIYDVVLGNSLTQSPLLHGAKALSAGGYHTCAITSAQEVACWGTNTDGELGTPGIDSDVPLQVFTGVTKARDYSASIDPSAGFFVSVDGTHHSVGIGSGWPTIAPTFPGGVISDSYTQSGTTLVSPVDSYNLSTALAPVTGHQVSNYLFPTGWPATNPTVSLIGGGTVMIDPQSPSNISGATSQGGTSYAGGTKGSFTATALSPMSTFTAQGGWAGAIVSASIQIQGTLGLDANANTFIATDDDVVFGFGPYTVLLPAGSFTQSGTNSSYSGTVNGSPVQVTLTNTAGRSYTYSVAVQSTNLTGVTTPVPVALYIGDNAGSETASALAQKITFRTVPGSILVREAATLSAVSTSGLAVGYSSLTPSICTVSRSTVTGRDVGTCTIAASQAGNGIFAPAQRVTVNIAVNLTVCHGKRQEANIENQSMEHCRHGYHRCCEHDERDGCCDVN